MAVAPIVNMTIFALDIAELGAIFVGLTYGIAALNFVVYVPVAILWVFTVIGGDRYVYKRYRGWLIASNIYGWLMSILNITWYIILILFVLIFHTWSGT